VQGLKKRETITNLGASIRAKLYNVARETERDFDSILLQYFQERFLYRLSISEFRRNFILKGALLLLAYKMPLLRPTKDIDFLLRSITNNQEKIKSIIGQVASIEAMDGVSFVIESISAESIIENADYGGIRVKIGAMLDNARKVLQLDIGFGDIVVAGPVEMDFPILLEEQPVPHLQVYSTESAIAEKFEALVKLNILSSRMKDIYDILFLAAHESFSLKTMHKAILETFRNRVTPLKDRMSIKYILNKKYDKAIDFLSKLHKEYPDFGDVQYSLLDALFATRKNENDYKWTIKPKRKVVKKNIVC
jgi:predicted nucleotidyltransferase component of viral defense system